MIWIGIDPGVNGGIAFIREGKQADYDPGVVLIGSCKIPDTYKDTYSLLVELESSDPDEMGFALLESAQASPAMGSVSSFNYGKGAGALEACLEISCIKHELVKSGEWQRSLRCLSGGKKAVTRKAAQKMFPTLKITDQNADALLIAEYARRLWVARYEKSSRH